ncbi:hypothetical protein F5Y12DRAFT_785730 [Xylaria sp. FL1777]|nr:hypothetical protein F5Y12DRAFT_785730 [Xylaria sp. FL1777]
MLVLLGSEGACVTGKEPEATVDPAGTCEEIPVSIEELDGEIGPDVDRADGALLDNPPEGVDGGPLELGIPVEGVTTEPVKEAIGVPGFGLGGMIECGPTPTDEVLPWPLNVSAPVFPEVIRGSEVELSPAVGIVMMLLLIELIPARDEVLLGIPEDNGIGLVSGPGGGNGVGSVVDTISEAEPGLVRVAPLVMLTDGKKVALVEFKRGYGPEVKVSLGITGTLVLTPELVPEIDPPDPDESEDALPDAKAEVEIGPVTGTLPEMSSVLNDGPGVESTVELGIVKGGFAEREPDGASDPPVAVVTMPLDLDPVSDANDTVPLDADIAVELVRVKGGLGGRDSVGISEPPVVFNTVIGMAVVRVVPVMVVGSTVSTVGAVTVVSTVVVNVLPVTVVGGTVTVTVEDETSVLFVVPELNAELAEPGGLLNTVEFVTGYGAELDGCTGMAEGLPLALVRLAPEEDAEVGGVPDEADGVDVTVGVVNPPLGTDVGFRRPDELDAGKGGWLDNGPVELTPTLVSRPGGKDDDSVGPLAATVELGNGYGPVEEPIADPDVPVDNGGAVPESEPVLGTPGNSDVELLALMVTEGEGGVVASVEKLSPLVRLPLGFTELSSSDEMRDVIEDTPEPPILGSPVGPAVATVELVIENVPDTDSLELLSGKGAVDEAIERGVPEENAVPLPIALDEVPGALDDAVPPEVVERGVVDKDPVMIERDSVLRRPVVSLTPSEVELLGGYRAVCELFCEGTTEVVVCPDGGPFVDSLVEADPALELVGTPVPPDEPPVGPTDGSEEFVIGKGVTSLAVTGLVALVFIGHSVENEPEAGTVKELDTPKEVFVTLANESDEFVSGKGVIALVALAVGVEELVKGYRLVSPALKLDPDVTRKLVSPPEPLVGLTAGAEEFVKGNGAVSLPLTEFVDAKGVVTPVLTEPVMSGTDVGIDMDSALEVDVPVVLDKLGTDGVNHSPEVGPAVLLNRLLVIPPVGAEEFVRGNGIVSVGLIENSVVVGIEFVNDDTVENPVLNNEFVGPVGPVGPGATTVEFESG